MTKDRDHTSKSKLNLKERDKVRNAQGKPMEQPMRVGCTRMGKDCGKKLILKEHTNTPKSHGKKTGSILRMIRTNVELPPPDLFETGAPKPERSFWSQVIFGTPPKFIRMYGPKYQEIGRQFVPSVAYYGAATLLLTVWICEWKGVLQYLPYYNGKYKSRDE